MDGQLEEWKEYPDDPDYMISSQGRVLGALRMLKVRYIVNNFGRKYASVRLKSRNHSVANLMARTFLREEMPDMKRPNVKYKDGNPMNIDISNLRWASPKEMVYNTFK